MAARGEHGVIVRQAVRPVASNDAHGQVRVDHRHRSAANQSLPGAPRSGSAADTASKPSWNSLARSPVVIRRNSSRPASERRGSPARRRRRRSSRSSSPVLTSTSLAQGCDRVGQTYASDAPEPGQTRRQMLSWTSGTVTGSRSDNRDEPRHRTACGGRGSKQRSPPATGRGAGLRGGPGLLLGRTHARPGVRRLVAGRSAAHRCLIQIRCPMSLFS